jgi:tetratricopeptide (TPR) repeat protein
MRDLCRIKGFETDLSLRAARFAQQCDRHAIAREICDGALERRATTSPELLVLAGHVARESGDFPAARARYLAALDAGVDLDRHHVLSALTNTRRYTDASDPDLARCVTHFSDTAHPARSRASAGFALAKIRDDLGDYKAAAQVLREANAMAHHSRWNSATWKQFVDERTHERPMPIPTSGASDFVPVFVVGIPRSGTTLTASLLARGSGARDRGELRALRFIADNLLSGGHLANAAAMAEAASLYRTLAVQDDAPVAHYLDQDPLNFRYLHIAGAMFPQARVIHVRRNPRDTALSLWSQDFAHPDMAFAYDFADMAAFMEGHDALMRHWHVSLRIPIYELEYEKLVAHTEATLVDLRSFIGAPVREPDHPEDDAPVQSASVWQARQPVYRTSVGRWRHYAPYVPELENFAEQG